MMTVCQRLTEGSWFSLDTLVFRISNLRSIYYIFEVDSPDYFHVHNVIFMIFQEAWQKGKLSCTKCKGRLGSFNFIKTLSCPDCHQHTLPSVHILKDRVDVKFVGNSNTGITYSSTQRSANPHNLTLQGASLESGKKQNETSDNNNSDNFKSDDLTIPEKLTVIKEICSPNETLPDSPSFQNAQDTDSEPVGQSSQDSSNIIHSSDAHMNKERYLEDMVKRTNHQNVCNLDFSWASVKHVSEKDIETTKASKPSDLVTDGDREVDNYFHSFQISEKGKNSVELLNAYENKNVPTLNHDMSNCGVLNDEENVISDYQLQTYEETADKEIQIIQEDSSEKEINIKLISGTEKTDSDVDSVINFPCLFPREGAGILTTNDIYLHEKPNLDLHHLESVTECERVQDYACSIGSNSTLLGDESSSVFPSLSITSLENQKSQKSSNLDEEEIDPKLSQLLVNEYGTSCGHRNDSIQDNDSGHRHDSFQDDDSDVKCRLTTKECVSDYESLTGMREKFTEIRKLVENINMQEGYDHDDMENSFEKTEHDISMLNSEIRNSEFGMADGGDIKVQLAAMQSKPDLFDKVQQATIQTTSELFDNGLDNSILLGAYSKHNVSEATSITSNPFELRSSSVLEEDDFMLQPFNNNTETDSTAGGQNLESDQNRGSTNGGNIDVDVDISLAFDFLETDGRRGRKRRNRRTRREKKGNIKKNQFSLLYTDIFFPFARFLFN